MVEDVGQKPGEAHKHLRNWFVNDLPIDGKEQRAGEKKVQAFEKTK